MANLDAVAEAERDVRAAEAELIEARAALTVQQAANIQLKKDFTKALTAFTAAYPMRTPEQLVHETNLANVQLRRDIAEGRVIPRRAPIANSAVDRTAAYSQGGDANDFVRKQMRRGHHHAIGIDGRPTQSYPSKYRGMKV